MKKILIIEDDVVVANVYRNKFITEGFAVETATDGVTGLHLIKNSKPDLVILDLMLPEMPGVELMKQVRAIPEFEKLPIIVFSNTYLSNVVKEAWKAGATKCFSKASCTPKQVIEAVRSLMPADGSAPATPPAAVPAATPPAPSPAKAPEPKPDEKIQVTSDALIKLKMADPMKARAPAPAPAPVDPLKDFTGNFPTALAAVRTSLQVLIKSEDDTVRQQKLDELFNKVHGMVGGAGLAGMLYLSQMSDALEALLKELQEKPSSISPSTLRTTAHAVDFLDVLFQRAKAGESQKNLPVRILVVDDELLSRRAVTHALEKAKLQSQDVEDPLVALKLLSENTYDLVFLDADMPGMNGFELCAKLRTLPNHKKTPVVFVTSLNDFVARANSTMAGANDFIAKPFLFIELAVKALGYVLRGRLETAK